MRLKVGLCGFTIGAAAYFDRFDVVEVQQTFYDPPAAATLERWRAQAPPSFEFTMKAWQVITHRGTSRTYRRLKSPFTETQKAEAGGFRLNDTVLSAWKTTVACARRLRATAILFQCPASFRPTDDAVAAMRRFFETVDRPDGVHLLWEPRGAWPDELVLELCNELELVHAVDPFVRPSVTPHLTYWRLHGNGSHYSSYSDEELARLKGWLAASEDTYAMFNNIPRVADSKRFLTMVP